jgi:hypothetical protein
MSTGDTINALKKASGPAGFFFGNPETTAMRKAREAREEAIRMAKNDLELKKAVADRNNATAQDAVDDINGQASDAEITQILTMMQNGMSPEQISAQMGLGQEQGNDYSMFGGQPAPAPQAAPAGSAADRLGAAIQARGADGVTGASGPFMSRDGQTVSSPRFGARTKPVGQEPYIDKGAYQGGVDTMPASGATASTTPASGATASTTPGWSQDENGEWHQVTTNSDYDPYNAGGSATGRVAPDGGSVGQRTPKVSDFSADDIAKATALANKGRWSQKGEYDKQFTARKGIYEQLKTALDGIQDPEAKAALAPVVNAAFRSDATKGQQQFAMDKLKGLTDVRETAEEKLMREVARRNQENQMVSQRKATLGNLAARGQLGAGAELASMLGAQAQTSGNRVMDEMAANANAQKRAIDALGKYSDMGLQLGNQDITEGSEANKNNQLNNSLTEQHNQFVTKNDQQNKHDKTRRIGTIADAGNDVVNAANRDTNNLVTTKGTNAALLMGTATGGANLVTQAGTAYAKGLVDDATRKADEEAAKGSPFNPLNL